MKTILIAISFVISGCITAPIESINDNTYFVTESNPTALKSAKKPIGFAITPLQAYLKVVKGRQKFSWSIYADSKNYYIVRNVPLMIPTSSYARMYGRRVNGMTGKSDQVMEE